MITPANRFLFSSVVSAAIVFAGVLKPSCTFAQVAPPCSGLYGAESISALYAKYFSDVSESLRDSVGFTFEEPDGGRSSSFMNWAKANGYSVIHAQRPSVAYEVVMSNWVIITRKLDPKSRDSFSNLVDEVMERKASLGIANCGGVFAK